MTDEYEMIGEYEEIIRKTTSKQADIVFKILNERFRQEALCAAGKFPWTPASLKVSDIEKLPVLAEEFGEVSREVCEIVHNETKEYNGESTELIVECKRRTTRRLQMKLREELIQIAAVAMAWVEALNEILK